MMTRKDFEIVATALRQGTAYACYQNSSHARNQHALMCNDMATSFSGLNPRFDRSKFLKACGLDDETIAAL
jgi:hypothetical protein